MDILAAQELVLVLGPPVVEVAQAFKDSLLIILHHQAAPLLYQLHFTAQLADKAAQAVLVM
jgi:hypothetical protein